MHIVRLMQQFTSFERQGRSAFFFSPLIVISTKQLNQFVINHNWLITQVAVN